MEINVSNRPNPMQVTSFRYNVNGNAIEAEIVYRGTKVLRFILDKDLNETFYDDEEIITDENRISYIQDTLNDFLNAR